jgi:hypothetical protein
MRLILLALFLASCSSSPTAPVKPARAQIPISPGQPGGTEPWYHGFYSDGTNWLRIGQGRDEATIVALLGDSVHFHCQRHREYVTGQPGELWQEGQSWMFGFYDSDRKGFSIEMDKVTDHRDEYVSWFLARQP